MVIAARSVKAFFVLAKGDDLKFRSSMNLFGVHYESTRGNGRGLLDGLQDLAAKRTGYFSFCGDERQETERGSYGHSNRRKSCKG